MKYSKDFFCSFSTIFIFQFNFFFAKQKNIQKGENYLCIEKFLCVMMDDRTIDGRNFKQTTTLLLCISLL